MTLRSFSSFTAAVSAPLVVAVIAALGCSEPAIERVPVSGRVLIDGEPLGHGRISVSPAGARVARGKIREDGTFVLSTYERGDGVPLGEHPVAINAAEQISSNSSRWHAPKKYAAGGTSGLTLRVEGATDDAVIELTWGGGKPFTE